MVLVAAWLLLVKHKELGKWKMTKTWSFLFVVNTKRSWQTWWIHFVDHTWSFGASSLKSSFWWISTYLTQPIFAQDSTKPPFHHPSSKLNSGRGCPQLLEVAPLAAWLHRKSLGIHPLDGFQTKSEKKHHKQHLVNFLFRETAGQHPFILRIFTIGNYICRNWCPRPRLCRSPEGQVFGNSPQASGLGWKHKMVRSQKWMS